MHVTALCYSNKFNQSQRHYFFTKVTVFVTNYSFLFIYYWVSLRKMQLGWIKVHEIALHEHLHWTIRFLVQGNWELQFLILKVAVNLNCSTNNLDNRARFRLIYSVSTENHSQIPRYWGNIFKPLPHSLTLRHYLQATPTFPATEALSSSHSHIPWHRGTIFKPLPHSLTPRHYLQATPTFPATEALPSSHPHIPCYWGTIFKSLLHSLLLRHHLQATPTLPATQALSSSYCSWYRFAIKFRLARWRHWDVFLLCAASLQRRIARIYLLSPGVFRVSFLPTSLLSDLFVVFCSYALLRRIKQGRVTSNAKGKTIVVVDSGYRQRPVRAGNKNI